MVGAGAVLLLDDVDGGFDPGADGGGVDGVVAVGEGEDGGPVVCEGGGGGRFLFWARGVGGAVWGGEVGGVVVD